MKLKRNLFIELIVLYILVLVLYFIKSSPGTSPFFTSGLVIFLFLHLFVILLYVALAKEKPGNIFLFYILHEIVTNIVIIKFVNVSQLRNPSGAMGFVLGLFVLPNVIIPGILFLIFGLLSYSNRKKNKLTTR